MNVEVVLEPERTDIQVTIHAPAATPEVEALAARLLAEESGTVLGFRGAEAVPLDPADILRSLGGVLGRYDGERQRESLSAACLALRGCLAEAEAERKRLGKAYGAMGTAAGALLAILLL